MSPPPAEVHEPGPPSRDAAPRVIGVLGGIASGKSAAARALAGPDGWTVSADEIAHEVLRSPEVAALLRARFGPEALGRDGAPDRAWLARRVFDPASGAEDRAAIEGWTHPRVRARILERLQEARRAGVPRVVLDVPLLLENDARHGLARRCDVLVFVDASDEERDRRAQEARGWPPGEVARREAFQLPLAEKRALANHVLDNNGTPAELAERAASLLRRLERTR